MYLFDVAVGPMPAAKERRAGAPSCCDRSSASLEDRA